jgi:hypothetical protein
VEEKAKGFLGVEIELGKKISKEVVDGRWHRPLERKSAVLAVLNLSGGQSFFPLESVCKERVETNWGPMKGNEDRTAGAPHPKLS